MTRRLPVSLVAIGGVVAVACIDMSAPKGAASISVLQLPSPSVIVGDVMRDSNGTPTPISVIAYDAAGTPITGLPTEFFITDSGTAAHLTADDVLAGDRVGTIHIVGQVGVLQTPVATVPITYAPVSIAASGTLTPLVGAFDTDSAASIGSTILSAAVKSSNDSASQGIVVHFTLRRAPSSKAPKSPSMFLVDDNGTLVSFADTTDGSGVASRRLVFVPANLTDSALTALFVGKKTDTAIVEARASYKGVPLTGSPVTFFVPITVVIK